MIELEEEVIIISALHHNLDRKKTQEKSKNPKFFGFGKYGPVIGKKIIESIVFILSEDYAGFPVR